jgi:hypothetical protein
MKKVLAAFALAGAVYAQPPTVGSFNCTGTGGDNISTTDANWINEGTGGEFVHYVADADTCRPPADSISLMRYNEARNNDQYAEVTLVVGGVVGPAVRISTTSDGYGCRADGYITRYDDLSGFSNETVLVSGLTTAGAGDVLRCEVSGTTITRKINGATQGSTTDATYASGQAGIVGSLVGTEQITDWASGDLGAASSCPVCAKSNSPIRGGGLLGLVKDVLHVR